MPLEAVMICLDNSDWTRNSDCAPTRLQAQGEAANYIANGKMGSNQETEVGILSLAGHRVELHCSMTRNVGTVMNSITKDVRVGGVSKFADGLKIAQLALKNRQNKNQKQRIILFVASPLNVEVPELERIGKNFKKNAIAIDVINFGTENATNGNAAKLEALVNSANSGDNSHFVNIPPGPQMLGDVILSSPIMSDSQGASANMADPELTAALAASLGQSAGAAAPASGGINFADFGIDPNLDPDLAMALRMSMEDEKQRQDRVAATATTTSSATAPATTTTPAATTTTAAAAPPARAAEASAAMDEEEDPDLLAAIAMSMTENLEEEPAATPAATAATTPAAAAVDPQEQINHALKDKEFLASLLDEAGVEDDAEIEDILMGLGGDENKKKDEKPEDKQ